MNFKELKKLSLALRSLALSKQKFTLLLDGDEIVWSSVYYTSFEDRVSSLKLLADYLAEKIRFLDLKSLSFEDKETIRRLQEVTLFLFKRLKGERKGRIDGLEKVRNTVYSLCLGGKVPPYFWSRKWTVAHHFLEANNAYEIAPTLGLSFEYSDGDIFLPVYTGHQILMQVPIEKIKEIPLNVGGDKGSGKIRFWFEDSFIMETDMSYKLSDEFIFIDRGIRFFHRSEALSIPTFDRVNPEFMKGESCIEIFTTEVPKQKVWFVFKEASGRITSASMENGKIIAPPKEAFAPFIGSDAHRISIKIPSKKLPILIKKLGDFKSERKMIRDDLFIFRFLEKELGIEFNSIRPFVAKHKRKAYLLLPSACIKKIVQRGRWKTIPWKIVLKAPHTLYYLDIPRLRKEDAKKAPLWKGRDLYYEVTEGNIL